jgi:hypothetical protein
MDVSGINGSKVSSSVQATHVAVDKTGAGGHRAVGGVSSGGAGKSTAASGSSSSSQSTVYDKKDANKDGVVSALEEATYDLAHPSAKSDSRVDVTA